LKFLHEFAATAVGTSNRRHWTARINTHMRAKPSDATRVLGATDYTPALICSRRRLRATSQEEPADLFGSMDDTSGVYRMPAIAMSGVDLSLGRGPSRVHILKSIDLTIGRGEAVGLVGPSGSGKSTLLMVMAGLERAMPARSWSRARISAVSTRTRWRDFAVAMSVSCFNRFI
jgi:ABC-type glutathione transport system ATPase component